MNVFINDENLNEDDTFIYKNKMRYNVGLNSIFSSVHDFFSLLSFIDAFELVHKL